MRFYVKVPVVKRRLSDQLPPQAGRIQTVFRDSYKSNGFGRVGNFFNLRLDLCGQAGVLLGTDLIGINEPHGHHALGPQAGSSAQKEAGPPNSVSPPLPVLVKEKNNITRDHKGVGNLGPDRKGGTSSDRKQEGQKLKQQHSQHIQPAQRQFLPFPDTHHSGQHRQDGKQAVKTSVVASRANYSVKYIPDNAGQHCAKRISAPGDIGV